MCTLAGAGTAGLCGTDSKTEGVGTGFVCWLFSDSVTSPRLCHTYNGSVTAKFNFRSASMPPILNMLAGSAQAFVASSPILF